MASLSLKSIYKKYPGGVTAVSDFNLEIKDKEFIVLVGPSGCGKSTTLRMIAGLEEISEGELYIGDRLVNDVAPKDRDIAMVFQNYALYPHMTVYENMAFALKLRHAPKDEIDKKVKEAAEILDITQYLGRKPKALSGGQRQRVAIGRAIVRDPQVMLMDEPLSNLDAKLRGNMRSELIRLHQQLKSTFIYITHDQVEAMTMGDYIAVMDKGVIMQYGTPDEIYSDPQNIFTARFIGDPGMNIATRPDGAFWGFRSARASFRKPDGFDGISFSGAISKVANTAQTASGTAKYEVEIELPLDEDMRAGMSATATVTVGQLENALAIPVAAVQESGMQAYVYTALDESTGEPAGETPITTGLSDGEYVQVVEGLEEGDTVYYIDKTSLLDFAFPMQSMMAEGRDEEGE